MKESQAWRILAEEHEANRSDTPYLCDVLMDGTNERIAVIPIGILSTMRARIHEAIAGKFSAYGTGGWEPRADDPDYSQEARDSRVLACLVFSEIAADEERFGRRLMGDSQKEGVE